MILAGIPISENQCIGDSLQYINSAFQTLSSYKANLITAVDSPTIDLSYNSITGTLSADVTTSYLLSSNFTGTNQSLTSNGYQKLPGGLIFQWGVAMVAYGTVFTGTFPIAFPNGVLNITGTSAPNVPPQTSALIFVQTTAGNTSFNIVSYHINLSIGANAVYWHAIGY
jgi:hypothetical protein